MSEAFDITQVLNDLGPRPEDAGSEAPGWLRRSYQQHEEFVGALFQHVLERTERLEKSQPFVRYDLYHDLVVCNTGLDRDALMFFQGGSFETVSYDELHARCSALASVWQEQGVEPGAVVCIALPFGVDYVVALLTAIRVGAVATLVPGLRTRLSFERMVGSGAAFVVADAYDVADHVELVVLPPRAGQRGATHSLAHVYGAGEVVAQLFSPFAEDHLALATVTADDLYIGALRDNALVFRYGPGEQVTAPGFDPLQYQPQLLLAALHAGATWVEFPVTMPADGMRGAAPRVIGVSPALLEAKESLTDELFENARLWYRSATEAIELAEWEPLERRLVQMGIPSMSIATSAPFSGCFACSIKGVRNSPLELFPIMGEPWELLDASGSEQPALGPMGLLGNMRRVSTELAVGHFTFTEHLNRYSFSGTFSWARSGRAFPVQAFESWVTELSGVDHAVLFLAPSAKLNDSLAVLVVFIDPLIAEDPDAKRDVQKRVEAALEAFFGVDGLPDQVQLFSTVAQTEDGKLNREWAIESYRSGILARKEGNEIFRSLSRLNRVFFLLARGGS